MISLLINVLLFSACGVYSGLFLVFSTQTYFNRFFNFQRKFVLELKNDENGVEKHAPKLVSLYGHFFKFLISSLLMIAPVYAPLLFINFETWADLLLKIESIVSFSLSSLLTFLFVNNAKSNTK